MRRLSDACFEIMKIVWESELPITTNTIMDTLGKQKNWKAQTIITLLMRLVELGFLRTEKKGRFRNWFPIVEKNDYMTYETNHFVRDYYKNSLTSLFAALTDNDKVDPEELAGLEKLIRQKKNQLKRKNG